MSRTSSIYDFDSIRDRLADIKGEKKTEPVTVEAAIISSNGCGMIDPMTGLCPACGANGCQYDWPVFL